MEVKDIIRRAREIALTPTQIAFIVDMPPDVVKDIIIRNGWAIKRVASSMPDGYYIEQLSNGKSIIEIANALGCTRQAVYRVLKRRGITQDAYRTDSLKPNE